MLNLLYKVIFFYLKEKALKKIGVQTSFYGLSAAGPPPPLILREVNDNV